MEKQYDVTIEYVNEIRCRVKAERNIFSTLRREFSFYANGYKFHPLYKQGKWDGTISMIDGKGLFYNGLIKNLVKYCVKHNLTINIQSPEKYLPQEISDKEIEKLKSYIKFAPYDYQEVSVKKALSKKKLLVLSPTSCLDGDTEIEVYIKPKT